MRAATTPKSLRLSADDIERFARIQRYYPEAGSESELIKLAAIRGLSLMEAEVAGSGGGLPKGMTEEDLASVILPRILTVLTWLSRLGRLPHLFAAPIPASNAVTDDRKEADNALDEIDPNAADDIGGLGGDFLGDWPE